MEDEAARLAERHRTTAPSGRGFGNVHQPTDDAARRGLRYDLNINGTNTVFGSVDSRSATAFLSNPVADAKQNNVLFTTGVRLTFAK